MNKTIPPPKSDRPLLRIWKAAGRTEMSLTRVQGTDREFLPAALELLETPPSPQPVALMLTLCAFCVFALAWSFVGRLDVHAVAWGKIDVSGRAKVIQPLEPGKVVGIHAENGQRARVGQTLLELDPSEAQADANAAAESLAASRAEATRRRVAIDTVALLGTQIFRPGESSTPQLPNETASVSFDSVPEKIQARERAVLAADLAQLRETLNNLDKQLVQKMATRKRTEASISYQNALIQTLEGRVDMRQSAISLEVGTKVNLFDAKESLQKSQAQLASDTGQLAEIDAAMEEIISQKAKTVSHFVAENESKLAQASRKADETAQMLAKARARLGRTRLVSPIDGTVQQLAVTTIGQVVTTGQQLMAIVPSEGTLQIEAYVSNLDIGFVKPGQAVEIKVDAFPFTRFGTVGGKVLQIASEGVDEQEVKRATSNAIAAANSGSTPANFAPGQTQNFVFPVTIALDTAVINIDGVSFRLMPGMTVRAEIKTDSRRVIEYLLSPISRISSEAMRER